MFSTLLSCCFHIYELLFSLLSLLFFFLLFFGRRYLCNPPIVLYACRLADSVPSQTETTYVSLVYVLRTFLNDSPFFSFPKHYVIPLLSASFFHGLFLSPGTTLSLCLFPVSMQKACCLLVTNIYRKETNKIMFFLVRPFC